MHEDQKAGDKQEPEDSQGSGEQNGQLDPVGYTDPDSVRIFSTESLSCQYRKAGGKSHCKSEQQKRNRARRADGGQSSGSEITSYDDGVCHTVELLEDISDKQGKCKSENDRQDPAGSHVLLHGIAFGLQLRVPGLLVPAVGEPDGHGNIADKFTFL